VSRNSWHTDTLLDSANDKADIFSAALDVELRVGGCSAVG
jgi:hypothetical protein